MTTIIRTSSLLLGTVLALIWQCSQAWTLQNTSARAASIMEQVHLDLLGLNSTLQEEKKILMAASEFAFYRATARVYYNDLIQNPPDSLFPLGDVLTWIQGDCHVENFGAFDNDQGDIVYDLNDFDEAFLGDFRYDLWRATVSIVLVCKANKDIISDWSIAVCQDAVEAFVETYLSMLCSFVGNGDEKTYFVDSDNAYGRLDEFLDDVQAGDSREDMIKKWTVKNDNGVRSFDTSLEKIVAVNASVKASVTQAMADYEQTVASSLQGDSDYFMVKDVALRVKAGLGSYGTLRYYVLVEGPSDDQYDDLILDVKAQQDPRTYIVSNSTIQLLVMSSSAVNNHQGARVTEANRALLNHADNALGYATIDGQAFSVRQRSPWKETFDTSVLTSDTRIVKLSEQWASILAAAHARSDNDYDDSIVPDSFEKAICNRIGSPNQDFIDELWDFAQSYASQVTADFSFFTAAVAP